jgi:hypothetical protein
MQLSKGAGSTDTSVKPSVMLTTLFISRKLVDSHSGRGGQLLSATDRHFLPGSWIPYLRNIISMFKAWDYLHQIYTYVSHELYTAVVAVQQYLYTSTNIRM